MRNLFSGIVQIVWALWFGGIIALFMFVVRLFSENRDLAKQAAPQLFATFEHYQLGLAGIALLFTIFWRIAWKSRLLTTILIMLVLSLAASLVSTLGITPRMQALLATHQSGSPEFMKLHGYSMIAYTSNAVFLAVTGLLLPPAIRAKHQPHERIER
ncbi:MAG TPA: DUF4149 domain-containing protein [Tepidisphaeraceae bacterium]|nr:DUF4149 domain-containing protein [Tepidisphaeraceae bacterium]